MKGNRRKSLPAACWQVFCRVPSEDLSVKRTIESYLTIATQHWNAGHTYEEGMHLLFRNILVSPRFLYRSLDSGNKDDGRMDDYDLATRLSYFLTQTPPDETLIDLAQRSRLSATNPSKATPSKAQYWVLRREA